MSPETRNVLHKTAKKVGLGHKAFSRPLTGDNGFLELALDSILTELGDESKYVEYWTRQEWRSIEAHADVDEFLAKAQDADGTGATASYRYPNKGHVLYLQVGSQVSGPTCIFPDRQSGGDLLRPKQGGTDGKAVDVVTVPVVPGRLLRFQGDFLHAVPRPTDHWLIKFVQGAPKHDPEEEWGRSVVLFNTWDEPPLEVPVDSTPADDVQAGDALCAKRSEWSNVFSLSSAQNEGICPTNKDSAEGLSAKIWLLGNQRRRDHLMRTLKLAAPEHLRAALYEAATVSHVLLEQP